MRTNMSAVVLLSMLVGCIAPPSVNPFAGGGVTIGPEAECLAREAGAVQVFSLFTLMGSGVALEDDLVLSARHVVRDGGIACAVNGVISTPQFIRSGARTLRDQDWTLFRADVGEPFRPCPYRVTHSVKPGQDVLVIGYWHHGPGSEWFPTAVYGTLVPTPAVFASRVGNLACFQLDSRLDFPGLSGAPVLVKDPGSAEWKLAGVFTGKFASDRGHHVYVFTRLPRRFSELMARAPPRRTQELRRRRSSRPARDWSSHRATG